MDEPLWFGHLARIKDGCKLSITDLAKDVAGYIAIFRRVFPHVKVGDIEPFANAGQPSDWLDQIRQWIVAFHAATGDTLAFFHADMGWDATWHQQLAGLVRLLHAQRVKFGIIYNGSPDDPNGVVWTQHAEERFLAAEADPALVPAQAILQTWMQHPLHMLPDTQPGTMTWLVNRYAAAATHVSLRRIGDRLEGQLTGADGQPLSGRQLRVMAVDRNDALAPTMRTLSGTVPKGAAGAVFALRINRECACSGPVDVTIGPLRYRDGDTGAEVVRKFAVPGTGRAGGTHIVAPKGHIVFNTTPGWRVTQGDRFSIQIPLDASETSMHSGYVALIFLSMPGREVRRLSIPLTPSTLPLGQATTDRAGNFAFALPASWRLGAPGIRAEFPGSDSNRPASASIH